jgi:histidinol dehydrogenase
MLGAIDRMADDRRRKQQERSREREADLRREIDRILDKVNREGMAALTDEERRFLKQASDKLRR